MLILLNCFSGENIAIMLVFRANLSHRINLVRWGKCTRGVGGYYPPPPYTSLP